MQMSTMSPTELKVTGISFERKNVKVGLCATSKALIQCSIHRGTIGFLSSLIDTNMDQVSTLSVQHNPTPRNTAGPMELFCTNEVAATHLDVVEFTGS